MAKESEDLSQIKSREDLPSIKRRETLPIGTVLMYNGGGIANVPNRLSQIGDEVGDTITLAGWYVCNGKGSTPDLIDKFIRSEVSSGNTGGSDSVVLSANQVPTHTTGIQSVGHNHSASEDTHNHPINIMKFGSGAVGVATGALLHHSGTASATHSHTIGNESANHTHTYKNDAQVDIDNKPNYYSLIFIIKLE